MSLSAHEVQFPRYHADVNSQRRTLFHMPILVDEIPWTVGDELRLIAHPNFPRCKVGTITDVRQVRLLAELDADLAKLGGVDRGDYLMSWDLLYARLPSINDPVVWRIEFRYGRPVDPPDPPEWSMAT
jgi:hypothetical protein